MKNLHISAFFVLFNRELIRLQKHYKIRIIGKLKNLESKNMYVVEIDLFLSVFTKKIFFDFYFNLILYIKHHKIKKKIAPIL